MITDMPLAAFDLETTGVDVTRDRIVTATIITIDGSQVHTDEWLLDPGIDIPDGAAKIRLRAVPEGGRANAALADFLKENLGARGAEVIAGASSTRKVVRIRKA